MTAFTDADGLVLRVADTGAGVAPAHAEAVFQRGWSTKPSGPGGRGLGLALVRQAVGRHDGTLTVTEAAGGGAEFEARLPLPTVSSAARAAAPDAEASAAPTRQQDDRPESAQPALPGGDV